MDSDENSLNEAREDEEYPQVEYDNEINNDRALSKSPAKAKNLTIYGNFSVKDLDPKKLFGYLEEFKGVLADFLGVDQGEEVNFDELFSQIFSRIEEYTSEEIIGLSIYLVNMLLLHKEDLSDESVKNLFNSIFRLIENNIEMSNIPSLFIALEALGAILLSRAAR